MSTGIRQAHHRIPVHQHFAAGIEVAVGIVRCKVDADGAAALLQEVVLEVFEEISSLLFGQRGNRALDSGFIVDWPLHLEYQRQYRGDELGLKALRRSLVGVGNVRFAQDGGFTAGLRNSATSFSCGRRASFRYFGRRMNG